MKYYVFRRNSVFGRSEYISNFEIMAVTDILSRAQQVSEEGLEFIDIPYMNSLGFYPVDILTAGIRFLPNMWFVPPRRRFRPRIGPIVPGRGPRPINPGPRPAPGPFFGRPSSGGRDRGRPPSGGNNRGDRQDGGRSGR